MVSLLASKFACGTWRCRLANTAATHGNRQRSSEQEAVITVIYQLDLFQPDSRPVVLCTQSFKDEPRGLAPTLKKRETRLSCLCLLQMTMMNDDHDKVDIIMMLL